MLKAGTQNDDKFEIAYGGDSVSAGNGQDRIVYDATSYGIYDSTNPKPIPQTLDGGGGTDTLVIRLYRPQLDALKAELDDYAATLPREMNFYDQNVKKTADNPFQLNLSMLQRLMDGTLTTGQNNQANFFTFKSIGISIKQFEAIRFEVVNSPPDAADDVVAAVEDTKTLMKVADLLKNDTDVDGNTLTLTSVQGAENGTVCIEMIDGVQYVAFMPVENHNGPAKFTYTIADGKGGSDTAAVKLDIAAVNDAPVSGGAAAAKGDEDTTITGCVSGASDVDGDALSYSMASLPVDAEGNPVGTLVFNGDGTFSYTPPVNFHGTVTFSYVATDGVLSSAPAMVTLTVLPVNDAPVAPATKLVSVNEDGTSAAIAVGASDVDGDTLSYSIKEGAAPSKGVVSFDQQVGTFVYKPAANLNGADSFTVLVKDGFGGIAEQVVAVQIAAVNDAPTGLQDVNGDLNRVAENAAKGTLVGITAKAFDLLDGDTLNYHFKNEAGQFVQNDGQFEVNATTGVVTVFDGSKLDFEVATVESLTLWASDGKGGAVSRSFNVAVLDVAEEPTGFMGQRVDFDYLYPNRGTEYDDLRTVTVGDGVEIANMWGMGININITNNKIILDFAQSVTFTGDVIFNGVSVSDIDGAIPRITGATLFASDTTALVSDDVSFDANRIFLNLEGVSFTAGAHVEIDVVFA